jgi:protein involved in polysaccharide export with SLBB domain
MTSESPGLPVLMNEIKNASVSGRVMAEFDLDVLNAYPNLDTILEDEDKIMIPFITQQVYVYGEISSQGTVRYVPGKDLNYYINNAGGTLKTAEKNSIFVIHPNGKTERVRYLSSIFKKSEILIYPGSIIYVPQSGDLLDGVQSAAVWAPIISSIALSITSLSVLNNNN